MDTKSETTKSKGENMTKLSECISFPKEKDINHNEPDFCSNDTHANYGYNQSLKECKDAVDKMELDVEKIAETIYNFKWGKMDVNNAWENHAEEYKAGSRELAQAIADNLPKLLKEKNNGHKE